MNLLLPWFPHSPEPVLGENRREQRTTNASSVKWRLHGPLWHLAHGSPFVDVFSENSHVESWLLCQPLGQPLLRDVGLRIRWVPWGVLKLRLLAASCL
jgi:hypothetical protein